MPYKFTSEVNPRIKDLTQLLELNAGDLSRMLVQVDTQFRTNEKMLFSTEGASGGAKWPPLKRPRSPKKYRRKKIMQRTGALRKSLVNKSDPSHEARFTVKPRAKLLVGTQVGYAAYHIPGVLKNPLLPDRDTLQHTEEQLGQFIEIVDDHLKDKKERIIKVLSNWRSRRR